MEIFTYPAVFVMLGLILSLHLFVKNYRRKDGMGRVFILVLVGCMLAYYIYRFGIQIAFYCEQWISSAQANSLSKHAQIFLLAPLVFVEIIEWFYNRKR